MLARVSNESPDKVVSIVQAAGGSLIGRTRLQKMVYLFELAGFLEGFRFEYRHYGPYSEDLSRAILAARVAGSLTEEERPASWGGSYSVYHVGMRTSTADINLQRMIDATKGANPIALELAATAAYLAIEGEANPWMETVRRKSDKGSYIDEAKALYAKLSQIETKKPLPVLT